MPFAAALSQHPVATHAVGEVVGQVLDALGEAPDAAVLFVTGPFAGAMEDIAATVRSTLQPGALIGVTAASVLAGDREVEQQPAISLLAMKFGARRPGAAPLARAAAFRVSPTATGYEVDGDIDIAVPGATVVLLADPFTFPVDDFVDDLTGRAAGLTVVGGLASSAVGPGGNRLVADATVLDRGAVALVLAPGIGARALVSQGCRPVGEPLVITKATGNVIEEIAGQPALDRVMAQADAASPQDRSGMARALQVGLVTDERKDTFESDDFLIRPVLGADHERRAVAVGAPVEIGTTVQFHVRDADSAHDELQRLLVDAAGAAALVFTATGRGTALFGEPHHDAHAVATALDSHAVAGMFSAGEIGPVGTRHVVHDMTTTVLLLDDPC